MIKSKKDRERLRQNQHLTFRLQRLLNSLITCDVVIIVGASLAVSPANTLLFYAKNSKLTLIEINPDNALFGDEMDFSKKTAVDTKIEAILFNIIPLSCFVIDNLLCPI
ncbi:MAG: hypothetical protein WA667_04010 [Candidatus Nitrosopolaris sp.]